MKASALLKYGLAALLALGSLGTTACSSDPVSTEEEDDSPITLSFLVEGEDTYLLGYSEVKEISVRARYKSDGSPAEGRTVSFLVSGTAYGSTVSPTEVVTDEAGIATVTVTAGTQAATFGILVSSGSSNQLQFKIDVNGSDIGSLKVYYAKEANTTVKYTKLTTNLYNTNYDCNVIDWDSLDVPDATQVSLSDTLPVLFGDLTAKTRYTITVEAAGPEGNIIARGCQLSDEVVGREITPVTVNLTPLPATFTGTYQMATTLNLLDMIPGGDEAKDENGNVSAAFIVKQVLAFFENPGVYLLDTLVDLIPEGNWKTAVTFIKNIGTTAFDTYYCSSHDGIEGTSTDENGVVTSDGDTEAAYWDYTPANGGSTIRYSCWCVTNSSKCGSGSGQCGANGDTTICSRTKRPDHVGQYLNMMIAMYAPAWVGNIFEVGNSISAMVQKLTVGGELEIKTAKEAEGFNEENRVYDLTGEERWNSYMFTWTMGKNCSPDDPCCGQTVFGAGNTANNQLNAASAEFTGKATQTIIAGQDAYNFQIDKHAIALDYGNIVLYLLKNLAFPALTKREAPVTFSDTLNALIPMKNIGCWLASINPLETSTLKDNYDYCMEVCEIKDTRAADGTYDWSADASTCGMATQYLLDLLGKGGDYIDGLIKEYGTTSGSDKYKFMLGTDDSAIQTNLISDTNADLQADQIDLTLRGYVYFGDEDNESTGMNGTLEADFARVIIDDATANDRTTCHSDSQCVAALGDGRTCQPRAGLVSKCAKRMVCALDVGTYNGGAACTQDSDCKSGFCAPVADSTNKICYSACSSNSDCTSASASVCNQSVSWDFAVTDMSTGDTSTFNALLNGCMPN